MPAEVGAPALESLIGDLGRMELSPLGVDDLVARLREIVVTARRATSATFAILHLREFPGANQLVPTDPSGSWELADGPSHLRGLACPERAMETGRPYIEHGPATQCGGPLAGASALRPGEGAAARAAAPVFDQTGHVAGALVAVYEDASDSPVSGLAQTIVSLLEALAAQAGGAVTNARLAAKLREAQFETVVRLSVAAEYRDRETASHIQRMSLYSETVARHMGLPRETVELTRFASPMHDVGKLGIPDSILMKTGPLTDDEWRVMRLHTRIGADILGRSDSPILRASEQVAVTHHERIDGHGYPVGLSGPTIPLLGRISALSDAFDAITSHRCYKQAKPLEAGLDTVRGDAGAHFDPDCVDALEAAFTEVVAIHRRFSDERNGGTRTNPAAAAG